MHIKKRGQAATEFLTTYGWAILILMTILIVIATLGIFKPKQPNICSSITPIFCNDVRLTETPQNRLTLVLSSSGTSTKTSPDLRTKVIGIELSSPFSESCFPDSSNIVNVEQQTQISCDFSQDLKEGSPFKGKATIEYTLVEAEESGITHKVEVDFSGTVQETV